MKCFGIGGGRRSKYYTARRPRQGSESARLDLAPLTRAAATAVEALEPRTLFTVPPQFAETQIVTGLKNPTAMDFAPDGRIFVAEEPGNVRVVKDGQLLPTPFFNVPTEKLGERGLSCVTLDSHFDENHFVYLYWTVPATPQREAFNRITRVVANGDVADPSTALTIWEGDGIGTRINHMSGAMHFSPIDDKLYVMVGESNLPRNAQDLNTNLGKVIRINRDGSIPADNPYINETTGKNQAIWAMGIRNSFTYAFQPGTGRMLMNEVGNAGWEEINEGAPHANYGWPIYEGPASASPGVAAPADYKDPVYAYKHTDGCAIVGATFYNPANANFPQQYVGKYFFGDLCSEKLRYLDPDTGEVKNFGFQITRPVDLDVTPDGSMYVLNNAKDNDPGSITRIRFTGSSAPSINAQPRSQTISVGQPVTFSVTTGGSGLSYQWQRNGQDIQGATGSSYTINAVGLSDSGAQFRVRVSNSFGSVTSSAAALTVTTDRLPTATITAPPEGTTYQGGQTLTLTATASDPDDGALPASAYNWNVIFHHADHTHPFITDQSGVTSLPITIPSDGEVSDEVFYRIELTVTDSQGLSTTVTRDLAPQKAFFTVNTNVAGLSFVVDGQPQAASYLDHGVVGVRRQIAAPAEQMLNGQAYEFVGWSDGGAIDHTFLTPAADTTFTANYQPKVSAPTAPDAPDLTPVVTGKLPAQVIGGAKGKASVLVRNDGNQPEAGPVAVTLFLSHDATLDPGDTQVAGVTKNLKLKPGKAKALKVNYSYPSMPDGDYYLLAEVDPNNTVLERNESNNVSASATPIANRSPVIDLSGSFVNPPTTLARDGKKVSVTLDLTNNGTVPASGFLGLALNASLDAAATNGRVTLATLSKRLKLKAGAHKAFKLTFIAPAQLASGTNYFLTAAIDAGNAFGESNEDNNLVLAPGTFTVV